MLTNEPTITCSITLGEVRKPDLCEVNMSFEWDGTPMDWWLTYPRPHVRKARLEGVNAMTDDERSDAEKEVRHGAELEVWLVLRTLARRLDPTQDSDKPLWTYSG